MSLFASFQPRLMWASKKYIHTNADWGCTPPPPKSSSPRDGNKCDTIVFVCLFAMLPTKLNLFVCDAGKWVVFSHGIKAYTDILLIGTTAQRNGTHHVGLTAAWLHTMEHKHIKIKNRAHRYLFYIQYWRWKTKHLSTCIKSTSSVKLFLRLLIDRPLKSSLFTSN